VCPFIDSAPGSHTDIRPVSLDSYRPKWDTETKICRKLISSQNSKKKVKKKEKKDYTTNTFQFQELKLNEMNLLIVNLL
jgi:hypothetical protein